jgi:hypothetical protein
MSIWTLPDRTPIASDPGLVHHHGGLDEPTGKEDPVRMRALAIMEAAVTMDGDRCVIKVHMEVGIGVAQRDGEDVVKDGPAEDDGLESAGSRYLISDRDLDALDRALPAREAASGSDLTEAA